MPAIVQSARFTSACPPLDEYHFHAYSGGGLQVMALALLDERIQADQDLARVVSACTACGMCDVCCKFIMEAERQQVVMALKEHLVEVGLGPAAYQEQLDELAWAEGLGIESKPGDEVLLYAGAAADDPQRAATARKLAALLQRAGVSFGLLDAEPDSGIAAYWTGQRRAFEKQARRVVNLLDQASAKTIVTLCGADLGALRAKYPEYFRAPRANVLHASEFLLRLIEKGKLPLPEPVPLKLTYHDPCYLGRQSEPPQEWQGEERLTHGVMTYFEPPKPINYGVGGVFDAPRQVLRAVRGLELVEMYRVREYAFCCGGGGGVPQAHPNVARSAALNRLDEARDVGAEALVTACSHCRRNLLRWQEDGERSRAMPVLDLVDVVYKAAGLAARTKISGEE
jgi:Fe-S oxidoreductase